tara:strand:+ start:2849 stop:3673 length:825 start_codon:yes stop_codon:yes gene_type:complete
LLISNIKKDINVLKKIRIYQVDAFTSRLFQGNSAAVCPLESWLDDNIMQSIAMENNLSETAFFIIKNNKFYIRFFTPKVEIDLAGHPTLAAAHIIFKNIFPNLTEIQFNTKSGEKLNIIKKNNIISMDFPLNKSFVQNKYYEKISVILRSNPSKFLIGRYALAIFNNQKDIELIKPNFESMLVAPYDGIIISAPGDDCDFVSRFFAPKFGILEDPVTGSAHCQLIPYWSKFLNKNEMIAKQLSTRGGKLYCVNNKKRVSIGGNAVTYMIGDIFI